MLLRVNVLCETLGDGAVGERLVEGCVGERVGAAIGEVEANQRCGRGLPEWAERGGAGVDCLLRDGGVAMGDGVVRCGVGERGIRASGQG